MFFSFFFFFEFFSHLFSFNNAYYHLFPTGKSVFLCMTVEYYKMAFNNAKMIRSNSYELIIVFSVV